MLLRREEARHNVALVKGEQDLMPPMGKGAGPNVDQGKGAGPNATEGEGDIA